MPKRKKSANVIIEALEVSAKLQDIYEYVSGRDLVFVEIPSAQLLVPKMDEKELKEFQKTGLEKFYRGVHPIVLYIDNKIAVPVNTSLLQPYYNYLRYLATVEDSVWAYAIPLTSKEVQELYYAVSGEELPEGFLESLSSLSRSLFESWIEEQEDLETLEEGGMDLDELLEATGPSLLGSVYSERIQKPAKTFFESYFKRYPASTKPVKFGDYGRVPVLSGHTGIAKSAIVKQLEKEFVPVVLDKKGNTVNLRPKVIVFKTGSVAYRELEEAVFTYRERRSEEDIEGIVYQNPFFEKFFFASDQYRYHFRKILAKLVEKGTITIEDGVPYYRGIALNTEEALNSDDKEVAFYARVVDGARPAVLFLDELDRNHALMVRSLMTSFIFTRSFQGGMTFYSTFIVAAWNRVHPQEENVISNFYLTAKTISTGGTSLDEGAFNQRFEIVYLHPADKEVYSPVIEHLVRTFDSKEGNGNLVGVRSFLEKLASTTVDGPSEGVKYNLLYYLPNFEEEDLAEDRAEKLLKGFATFRSYERLLTYLSNKKRRGDKQIYLPFVGSLLGSLFPTNPAEVRINPPKSVSDKFAKIFNDFIKENFGYEPFDIKSKDDKLVKPSTDRLLEESVVAGVPLALYGPPGLAKTSRVLALVERLNKEFFDRIRKDKDFREEVSSFLAGLGIPFDNEDPESLINYLSTEVLMYSIGSEGATNPSTISGANVPLNLPDHPKVLEFSKAFSELLESLGIDDELGKIISTSFASSLITGDETLVKRRVPNTRAMVMHAFLRRFEEAYGVLVFDEITRADFVTQGSFFDALSEGIIGGEKFEPETLARVHMVATGNYNSQIFGTAVSDVDAALVARFANFFVLEPTDEDLDSFIEHLIRSIKSTLPQGYDESHIDKLASHLRSKEGSQLTSFWQLMKSLFSVEGRKRSLVELKETLANDWSSEQDGVEKISAPFPSPRLVFQLILNHILPKWLPEFSRIGLAKAGRSESGYTDAFVKLATSGDPSGVFWLFSKQPGIDEKAVDWWLSEGSNSLLSSLNPYLVAKTILDAASSSTLITGSHPYRSFVVIPEPSEKHFPNLAKKLSGKALANLDFVPLRKTVATELGSYLSNVSVEGMSVADIADFPVYLAENHFELKPLKEIDWEGLVKDKSLRREVENYVRLMLVISSYLGNLVYFDLVRFIESVIGDKVIFFPGTELDADADTKGGVKKLLESRELQKHAFVAHLLLILELYSRAFTSAIATPAEQTSPEGLLAEIEADFESVRNSLKKEFGESSAQGAIQAAESEYGSYEVASSVVSSRISYFISQVLQNKFGIDLPTAHTILQMFGQKESDGDRSAPPYISKVLPYLRLALNVDELSRLLDLPNDEKHANILLQLSGQLKEAVLYINQDEVEEIYRGAGGDEDGAKRALQYLESVIRNTVNTMRGFGVFLGTSKVVEANLGDAVREFSPPVGAILPPSYTPSSPVPLGFLDAQDPDRGAAIVASLGADSLYFYANLPYLKWSSAINVQTPLTNYSISRRVSRETPEDKERYSHRVRVTTNADMSFVGGASLKVQVSSYVDVRKEQAEELSRIVQSEDFAKAKEEAHRTGNYYLASILNDLEVLSGNLKEATIIGSPTDEKPWDKGTVSIPKEVIDTFLRSHNTVLLASDNSELEEASEIMRELRDELVKRLADGRQVLSEIASVPGATSLDRDDEMAQISLDDLDILGSEETDMNKKAGENQEKEKKALSIAFNTKASTRSTAHLLTLLRKALDKSVNLAYRKLQG